MRKEGLSFGRSLARTRVHDPSIRSHGVDNLTTRPSKPKTALNGTYMVQPSLITELVHDSVERLLGLGSQRIGSQFRSENGESIVGSSGERSTRSVSNG